MNRSKALSRTTLALILAGAGLALPIAASPAHAARGGNESLQLCRSFAPFYEGNIIGPCTSYFQSHDRNARATTVYFCRTEMVPAGEFHTLGQCVRTIGSTL